MSKEHAYKWNYALIVVRFPFSTVPNPSFQLHCIVSDDNVMYCM